MKDILDVKEFSYFLRVNRNNIVKRWLEDDNIQNIFHKYSLPFVDKNENIFNDFCDCFISVLQWDLTIAECQVKVSFLKLLKKYNVLDIELFVIISRLKSSIEFILYQNMYLAYSLQLELEQITLNISTELVSTYKQINNNEIDSQSESSNLLNEYKRAVDISSIVSKTNPKGIITYVNDKFCEISGYKKNELIGQAHNIIRHPSMDSEAFKNLWDTIKLKKPWQGIITNMKKDGRKYVVDSTVIPILDLDGDIVEYIALRHDITDFEDTKEQLGNINKMMKNKVDELHSMTTSLEKKATIDSLTGIYNRMKFEEIMDEEIERISVNGKDLSILLLDIDYFKAINDTYGHQAGDTVLKELSSLISENIKTSDILARWGGEEFVIILPGTNVDGAFQFAEKLRKIIKHNHFTDIGKMTASFGVGQLGEYETKSTLFEKVDKALYIAKNNGRNRVEKLLISCAN
jgi:diguanylate cyclase (GGDEF)-like protein/PAS domain S-box-containing protein